MGKKEVRYFIFGATGYIGSYLYQRLRSDGYNVTGTSRRLVGYDGLFYYDIQRSDINVLLEKADRQEKKTAIICIAVSNIAQCYDKYEEAYDINVVKTKELIHKLLEHGFYVIYFSSDNVFDGACGGYTETSQTHPINNYGRMKAEMEEYLLWNKPDACILRISKVVSTQKKKQNVFTEWLDEGKSGFIRCIKGNCLSFVCMEDIYQACLIVSRKKMHGLYNVAGDRVYSRAELAREFYARLGISDIDIRELDLKEFGLQDRRPLNLGMSNQKFKDETGYRFMEMNSVIEKFIVREKGK